MAKNFELVDLVDEFGVIQKTKVARDNVNNFPNLCMQIVVGVILDSKGRILVEKRSMSKKSEPGKIDHVCGVIKSGETPEEAMIRESVEETGIKPKNLKIIKQGINVYGKYSYLFSGVAEKNSKIICSTESEWVRFYSIKELKEKEATGEFKFVDDFFENTDALAHR